jgi:BirA family biotin operon repressor/biotin-[acetyl-CoA-carboxylase] ligase
MREFFTAAVVQQTLAPRAVRFYDSVDSTNDLALDWLRAGAAAGSVVAADEQRRGRGRLGRVWQTPPGAALAVSVILRPPAAYAGQVTMLGALAIYDTLLALGADTVGIKWPNDVQVNRRKICGVLPEAVWDGSELVGVVLGIGLNVRVDFTDTDLEDTAISLEPALGRPVDRVALLADLITRVESWQARWPDVFAAWRERLTTLGQTVSLLDGAIQGLAEAVDEQGALLVRQVGGDVRRVLAGDVALS